MNNITDSFCIVVPAYNEEQNLAPALEAMFEHYALLIHSVIIINDGSSDRTGEVAVSIQNTYGTHRVQVINQSNSGHGASLMRGYNMALASGAAYIFQMDSDNQFDAQDFNLLWQRREEAYLLTGLRESRHDPLHRIILSFILQVFLNVLFINRFYDINSPFRLMRADVLRQIMHYIPTDTRIPNILIGIVTRYLYMPVLAIPVRHYPRRKGQQKLKGKFLLVFCRKCLGEILMLRVKLALSRKNVYVR